MSFQIPTHLHCAICGEERPVAELGRVYVDTSDGMQWFPACNVTLDGCYRTYQNTRWKKIDVWPPHQREIRLRELGDRNVWVDAAGTRHQIQQAS